MPRCEVALTHAELSWRPCRADAEPDIALAEHAARRLRRPWLDQGDDRPLDRLLLSRTKLAAVAGKQGLGVLDYRLRPRLGVAPKALDGRANVPVLIIQVLSVRAPRNRDHARVKQRLDEVLDDEVFMLRLDGR